MWSLGWQFLIYVIKYMEINKQHNVNNKYHDTRYYNVMEYNIKHYNKYEEQKEKYRTKKNLEVDNKIEEYKELLKKKSKNLLYKLKAIYEKNRKDVYKKKEVRNSNLLQLVSCLPMLILAYKRIRKSSGVMASESVLSEEKYNTFNEEQKNLYNKILKLPDEISMDIFIEMGKLIRKNKYPWGVSKTIYVDNSGTEKKRSITIPPFMDMVVQFAIKTVLECIYEPEFDYYNCSFGFRLRKSKHTAIYSLTNTRANGLDYALEGNIKSVYDKVNRKKMIEILKRKITDRKFLKFIETRLCYIVFYSESKKFIQQNLGLPHGGIDSLYLWNIYMHEFDKHIIEFLNSKIELLNIKRRGRKYYNNTKQLPSKCRVSLMNTRKSLKRIIYLLNKTKDVNKLNNIIFKYKKHQLKEKHSIRHNLFCIKTLAKKLNWQLYYKNNDTKNFKYALIKYNRKLRHKLLNISSTYRDKIKLRFIYTRYEDDFILLTNLDKQYLEGIKLHLQKWLSHFLGAELEIDKTKITNLKTDYAKFLGFEIKVMQDQKRSKIPMKNRITKKKPIIMKRTTGHIISCVPDRKRLLNRLKLKGFCDLDGNPREIPKLTILDTCMIIKRFNEIIRVLTLYYAQYIRNPYTYLRRWIYILKYSCLKTIAQKENISIKKVFKKYKYTRHLKFYKNIKEPTISVMAELKLKDETYSKRWTLLSRRKIINFIKKINTREEVIKMYWKAMKKK